MFCPTARTKPKWREIPTIFEAQTQCKERSNIFGMSAHFGWSSSSVRQYLVIVFMCSSVFCKGYFLTNSSAQSEPSQHTELRRLELKVFLSLELCYRIVTVYMGLLSKGSCKYICTNENRSPQSRIIMRPRKSLIGLCWQIGY